MKKLTYLIAITLMSAGVAMAAPVNKSCPVSGKDIDASQTSKHKGQEVAFCCGKCKAKFDADPAKFESKIKKD
jgi:YHS domain-containing protein